MFFAEREPPGDCGAEPGFGVGGSEACGLKRRTGSDLKRGASVLKRASVLRIDSDPVFKGSDLKEKSGFFGAEGGDFSGSDSVFSIVPLRPTGVFDLDFDLDRVKLWDKRLPPSR